MMEVACDLQLDEEAFEVITDEVQSRFEDVLAIFYEQAYRDCPVRTGAMRDSIRMDLDEVGTEASLVVGIDYAPYVEYRTGWFERSLESALGKAGEIWTQ